MLDTSIIIEEMLHSALWKVVLAVHLSIESIELCSTDVYNSKERTNAMVIV